MSEKTPLTIRRIFWLPLAAMWLLMAVEHPMVASVIARLAEPESNWWATRDVRRELEPGHTPVSLTVQTRCLDGRRASSL